MLALRYSWRFALLSIVALFAAGCGSNEDRYDTVPVRGVATCNGKPIANGVVNFTPMKDQGRAEGRTGRLALGKTDSEGRFRLTTYVENDGAITGRHIVTVSMGFSEETGASANKGFACRDSSEEVTVKSGMGEIKIDFGSKK